MSDLTAKAIKGICGTKTPSIKKKLKNTRYMEKMPC